MTTDDRPPEVSAEARIIAGDTDYLAKLNFNDRRVIGRAEFCPDAGSGWDYSLVQFPSIASAARGGAYLPPSEWHVYEADEPWDDLDEVTKSVRQWVGVVGEDSEPER